MIGEEVIAIYADDGDGYELQEVQKLVRCKECKHNHDGVCEYAEWVCKADDFCSYGEVRDE